MTLRDRIKELCRDNGISVNQFEQLMGFSKGYIGHLGKSTPNSGYIKKMADYFDVSVEYLLTGDGSEGEIIDFTEVEKRLIEYYRRLDAFNQGQIIGYMQGLLLEGDKDDNRGKD